MNCKCHHNNKSDKNCIELVPIFSSLNFDEMMEIAQITVSRNYSKGEMIYRAEDIGEKLFVIHKGKVKITRLSDTGKEQLIRVLGPGDFMGELSLFTRTVLTDNAEALESTTVCVIDGKEIKALMSKYPTIALKVLEELSHRLEKAETLIEYLGAYDVEKRIGQTLINLADDRGIVELDISKKDLAAYMGMSQETLSRKLSYFQEKGLIKQIGHRKIIILDKEGLVAREAPKK